MKRLSIPLTAVLAFALLAFGCKQHDQGDATAPENKGPVLAGIAYPDLGYIQVPNDLDSADRAEMIELLQTPGDGDTITLRIGFDVQDTIRTTHFSYGPILVMDTIPKAYNIYIRAECNRFFPAVNNVCIGLPPAQQTLQMKAVKLNYRAYSKCGAGQGICIESSQQVGWIEYYNAFGCPGNPVWRVQVFQDVCQ